MKATTLLDSDGAWNGPRATTVLETACMQRRSIECAAGNDEMLHGLILSYPLPAIVARIDSGEVIHESRVARALFRNGDMADSQRRLADSFSSPYDCEDLVRRLRNGLEVHDVELELRRSDGSSFWGSVSASLVGMRDDEVAIFNFVDISRYRSAEQRIARQNEALHQSEKLAALGTLLTGVAHELNNPLAVVSAQALLMQDTALDPKLIERAGKIARAADRCTRIVRTFLAMARKRPLEHAAVDINDVVESVMAVTSYSLRKSNIELKLELSPELPPVWANEDELNQVVTNLVVNAQQAIAECGGGGRLKLVSAYDDVEQTVLLSISDNGPGIAPEIRTRIFEPFFTTKEVGQGTGIGLAVCHRIVESLQGSIRVSSPAGQGAQFTISLPAARDDDSTVVEQSGEPAKAPMCRALVIDNEPEITTMLKEILALDGHEVRCATSGQKALKLLSRQDFQVILMDLRMPGIDGISLYKTLARLSPRLLDRIGFITGDTFSSSASEFLNQTERPYIEKPFTPGQVRGLVDELLSRARLGALVS